MVSLDDLVRRLDAQGKRPAPAKNGFKACCPAHEDRSPSLSLWLDGEGRIKLKCHAGCEKDAILAALGLSWKDLAPPQQDRPGFDTLADAIAWKSRKCGATCVRHWTYCPIFAVARFDLPNGKKEFSPIHQNGAGWKFGDPKGLLPLYHTEAIEPCETVYVVEGEKLVHLAAGIWLNAVTSAHGSKSAAKSDWRPLAGATVVIIPDCDDPGRKYAQDVAAILDKLDPRPTSIKVIDLALPEEGDDLEQWLAAVPDSWGPQECRAELERLAAAAKEWAPEAASKEPEKSARYHKTDVGNGQRFADQHRHEARYVHAWGKWLAWDGTHWEIDGSGEIEKMAKATARAIPTESQDDDLDERKAAAAWAFKSESRARIEAALAMAQSEPGVHAAVEDLDADPWLLCCPNGTVDLRTGKIREHARADLITRQCPTKFDADAQAPLWMETLERFLPDPEVRGFFRRWAGYALTGVIREHMLLVAWGAGQNGKSTILGALMHTLGSAFAAKAPSGLLVASRHEEHPTVIADLFGRRLVVANETSMSARLAEERVKELTGGDRLRARRLYEDYWEFSPTAKFVIATNHKPTIRGTDKGIWRRIKLVPFEVVIDDALIDTDMPLRLESEASGILAWAVRGCLEWQRDGLGEPAAVMAATADYREEQDSLGQFVKELVAEMPGAKLKASRLYAAYVAWAEAAKEFVLSQTAFGRAIVARGFEREPGRCIFYRGITLREDLTPFDES